MPTRPTAARDQLLCRANFLLEFPGWTGQALFPILNYIAVGVSAVGYDADQNSTGGLFVSIVRVGLAETKHFAEGYDAIFGKKKGTQARKQQAAAKSNRAKRKKTAKKK
jgi:hypothetical protein